MDASRPLNRRRVKLYVTVTVPSATEWPEEYQAAFLPRPRQPIEPDHIEVKVLLETDEWRVPLFSTCLDCEHLDGGNLE